MRAPVDDLLGAAPRRQAAQVGHALLGDDDVDVVLRVVEWLTMGTMQEIAPPLTADGGEEHALRHLNIIIAAYQAFLDNGVGTG